jgi:hypothetical protein
VDEDGPLVGLRDSDGNIRAALATIGDGPQLVLAEGEGKVRTAVRESRLEITDEQGFQTAIGATDLLSSGRREQSQKTSAASVVLSDKAGKVLWRLACRCR